MAPDLTTAVAVGEPVAVRDVCALPAPPVVVVGPEPANEEVEPMPVVLGLATVLDGGVELSVAVVVAAVAAALVAPPNLLQAPTTVEPYTPARLGWAVRR